MGIFRFILFLLLIAGCAPKVTTSSTTVEKDSLGLRVVHHHDTLRIKGDSIVSVIKQTVHDTVIVEKKGRTELDITRKNGFTTTKCKCDSIQKALSIALTDTTHYKIKVTTVIRTRFQDKPKTDWDKFCEGFTWFWIAALIGATIYRFRKVIPWLSWIP